MSEYFRPLTLGEAVNILADKHPKLVAGGTDMMVMVKSGYRPQAWMDLTALEVLRGISLARNELVIGAMTLHAEIAQDPLVQEYARALADAAAKVGSPQIRNMGTIGGNIANASPAGDLLPPLYALNARLDLVSKSGRRIVPVNEVFTGPKRTSIRADELIGWIRVPARDGLWSDYARLGTRNALSISKVGVALAARVERAGGGVARLRDCMIALGSVAPTVVYAESAMDLLEGRQLTGELVQQVALAAQNDARPIDDIRSTAAYRRAMVAVLVRRLLERVE